MAMYPLKFAPIYLPKVWGGRALERLGRMLPPGETIGESWELADLATTSSSGAGGTAFASVVSNGVYVGATLRELVRDYGPELLGMVPPSPAGEFPLLIKYLDAQQNLSVQVHPDRRYCRSHPDAFLKSEAWYIVDAAPGACIYKGVVQETTADMVLEAIRLGRLEELLIKVPVRTGDCHYLPSGTVHALGAGIVVAEVQTPSDTTFRLYDWGRMGRELHVEEALECMRFGPPLTKQQELRTRSEGAHAVTERLVQCEHFRIEKITMEAPSEHAIVTNEQMKIWMVLEGSGVISTRRGGEDKTEFERGETVLLPAVMNEPRVYLNEKTSWLEITFPQATSNLLA